MSNVILALLIMFFLIFFVRAIGYLILTFISLKLALSNAMTLRREFGDLSIENKKSIEKIKDQKNTFENIVGFMMKNAKSGSRNAEKIGENSLYYIIILIVAVALDFRGTIEISVPLMFYFIVLAFFSFSVSVYFAGAYYLRKITQMT